MTLAQYRAACELLGWRRRHLATATQLSYETVRGFEAGRPARPSTVSAIRTTLEAAGVEFTEGEVRGVRLRRIAG